MSQEFGPERPAGQGLQPHQWASGDRAIVALLRDPGVAEHVDLVITQRAGAYEVWAQRGMVRFRRLLRGGRLDFEILEQVGLNPIEAQDPRAVDSLAAELHAAHASGHPTEDANQAFLEPEVLSYPFAYERIAQLFDSPHAPDLVLSPKCYAFGLQPGQHGALDCVQSRAPLAFAGPGVRPGRVDTAARHVDIAPTLCRLMGFPLCDGRDASGRTSSERGVEPDVYLRRQDGRVLEAVLEEDARGEAAERAYLVVFDGLSHSELLHLLERGDPSVRHLRRILDRAALFAHGSTVNFPSITWPSHATILTGAWCGHHDIVNPSYYLRSKGEMAAPQAQSILTEGFLGDGVETLYEAFHRVYGEAARTAAIHEPQGRGADHAPLENRNLANRSRLKALTPALVAEIDPRHAAAGKDNVHREGLLDARGVAQVLALFEEDPSAWPVFVAHEFAMTDGAGHDYGPHGEGLRAVVAETDRRLGRVLDALEERGQLASTLFVFTSDHGMAPQNTALAANPARHLERIGMSVITSEPMLWLRDMAVSVEPAGDRRTARVVVVDGDTVDRDEPRPLSDVEVTVTLFGEAERGAASGGGVSLARLRTNLAGVAGFAIPADAPLDQIVVTLHHADFNPRCVRLNGRDVGVDARHVLYGDD